MKENVKRDSLPALILDGGVCGIEFGWVQALESSRDWAGILGLTCWAWALITFIISFAGLILLAFLLLFLLDLFSVVIIRIAILRCRVVIQYPLV